MLARGGAVRAEELARLRPELPGRRGARRRLRRPRGCRGSPAQLGADRAPSPPEPRVAEPLASEEAEVYAALTLGLARLRREERLRARRLVAVSGGIDSALVALIAADAARRPSGVTVRRHALPPLQRRDPGRRAGDRRATSGAELIEIPIESAMRAYEQLLARRASRATEPGPRRGEHPGADPRQPDDGALEQVRLAGADHRQQERDVGRLRDPLRRHGRRLRGDQGRLRRRSSTGWSATATSAQGRG